MADKYDLFQTRVLYIAIACLAAKFLLDSATAKDMFGTWWLTVKQANAVIMWLAAILSGKKFIDLLDKFKKVTHENHTDHSQDAE